MNFFKALVLGLSILTISACSSSRSGEDGEGNDGVNGAHTKASVSQIQELETKVGDRVFFQYDSPILSSEAQETLRKQAAFMDQNSNLSFVIEGNTDDRGTREYNIGLGERRANAAKHFLTTLGISPSRLTVVSYGKERPAVIGSDEWSWSQNRRAVTVAQ